MRACAAPTPAPGAAPAQALATPGGNKPPTTAASSGDPLVPLEEPSVFMAMHKPFVFIREAPSTVASMLGILRPGQTLVFGTKQGGWLRTAEPYDKGRYGWALQDGTPIGLGQLMTPINAQVAARIPLAPLSGPPDR